MEATYQSEQTMGVSIYDTMLTLFSGCFRRTFSCYYSQPQNINEKNGAFDKILRNRAFASRLQNIIFD